MNFLVYFISLITIYFLPKTNSQGSQKVPGPSSCSYYATINEDCGEPTVPATDLPKEATAIFFDGLLVDDSLNVSFAYPETKNDEFMKSMFCTGKPVFLFYSHPSQYDFMTAITSMSQENAKTEMSNLKKFLEPYKNISGIAVSGITIPGENTTTACLTEKLKIYLEEMRCTFPDYGIGLSLNGQYIIDMFTESDAPIWFDFSVLDSLVDFYMVKLLFFNNCTDEFKVGGTVPINGSATYTLDKITCHYTQLGIPKDKMYYMYAVSPVAIGTIDGSCDLTNAKVCARPNYDGLCTENTQSLFDKGVYAQLNGGGYILSDVDLYDDPYDCCNCGTPYPAFHRILAGYNGEPIPPECCSFDKK